MKPNWKDAPPWANYLAMDEDGCWYWYNNKPSRKHNSWKEEDGHLEIAEWSVNWKESLEQRPEVKSDD
jgi:hypothetical protein